MIGYGLKSGADQSMLARELQLYKARFGTKNGILVLVFEGTKTPVSKGGVKMATRKASREEDMELVGEAEEVGTDSATNPTQGARHVQALDKIMDEMETRVKEEEVQDVSREALEQIKAKIAEVVPQMAKASVSMVLGSIKDPTCLAIRLATDKNE